MLKKWMPFWTIPILMVFATGTVWLRLSIVGTTYAIHEAERELYRTRQNLEILQLKLAALRSPRRLEVLARTKFGLLQPKIDQVVQIHD